MIRKAMGEVDVKQGIKHILSRIDAAHQKKIQTVPGPKPTLVAVSKTKPISAILNAYAVGQRHFGENYVQELVEKGNSSELIETCKDIKWHFIGHLQRNKINKIISIPNLYMIETVDSEKLASSLDMAWGKLNKLEKTKLKVLVQVNTSEEDDKAGVPVTECTKLYRYILENCKNLEVDGIMTIGRFGHDYSIGPNPDFIALMKCYEEVCRTFELEPTNVQISMGMSDDFENAIEMGSTIVRVGSSIFGYRPKKAEN